MTVLMIAETTGATIAYLTPILAVIAPFISQFVKNRLKLSGDSALVATVVICVITAILGAWATGELFLGGVASQFYLIFTVATLIYKLVITSASVQEALPETLKNPAPTDTV